MKPEHLIIVDIESTCWEKKAPPGQQSEIIEIGVCLLALDSGEISAKRSLLVRPVRSKVSEFCTKLTTLTQAQVDEGISFTEACQILRRDYDSPHRAWASWGDYDRRMFEQQCPSFGVDYPFSQRHTNLKKRFAALYHHTKPVGMTSALKLLDLLLHGTHHRGDDDAYNIARITAVMLQRYGQQAALI